MRLLRNLLHGTMLELRPRAVEDIALLSQFCVSIASGNKQTK